jgi:hypothetical protein
MPLLNRNPAALARALSNNASPARDQTANEGQAMDQSSARDWGGVWDWTGARRTLFETCSNPGCDSSWMKLWRSRGTPIFEGKWCCSPDCTRDLVEAALRREMDARGSLAESHRHRVPLGLSMLEQGWITSGQLRSALEMQKAAGGGQLGQWLVQQQMVTEDQVTRALGLQWSCPVLNAELNDVDGMTALIPRFFIDAYGALPLRLAAGRILYLGFQGRPDPVLALAAERMTGLRVETGLVPGSVFRPAHERVLAAGYPRTELLEAASETALAHAMGRIMERSHPVESRLVRVHDCVWLRQWLEPQRGPVPDPDLVEDVIGSAEGR